MPKDNESIPLAHDASQLLETQRFSIEEMVRCEACLRASPPNRVNCLYCGAALPLTEVAAARVKPTLRPLERWELGYNNVLLPAGKEELGVGGNLKEIAALLRLEPEDLGRIFSLASPLPLSRTATPEEASLIQRRLSELGVQTIIVSDYELGLDVPTRRARTYVLDQTDLVAYSLANAEGTRIPWSELALLVNGSLFTRRVEVKERKRRRAEKQILDASEATSDRAVVDIYTKDEGGGWRVDANSFDFSCLGTRKGLLAGENLLALIELIRQQAPGAEFDASYNGFRQALELVWPSEKETQSRGLSRTWLGKHSIDEVMTTTNESQFTRYSRLRHYLKSQRLDQPE